MVYKDQKRIPALDRINTEFYLDWMRSGSALKHVGDNMGENDHLAIVAMYKGGMVDAFFFNRTAHGTRGFHQIFKDWFHRGTYYFVKERREEALHEIAYAIRPFSNPMDRKSATSCLNHTGLTRDEIREVEDLVGCNIAPPIRNRKNQVAQLKR